LDVLLRAIWIRRRTTADDLRDYDAGVTLKVSCLVRRPDADAKSIPVNGSLYLKQGDKVVWRANAESAELLAPGR
jgi:hypothetical protein